MIHLGGEGAFVRFWLPMLILAAMIIFLFPSFGPPDRTQAREAWDGVVALVELAPPPTAELQLIAAMALRTSSGEREWLVVGETPWAPGVGTRPLLLRTPPRGGPGARLARRVDPRMATAERVRVTLFLYPRDGLGGNPLLGTRLREGEWFDGEITHPLPPAVVELPHEIRVDDVRHRRWPGDPGRFDQEWAQFGRIDPGGLVAFIHSRVLISLDGEGGPQNAGAPGER